jgi:membrane protease YdiL (CAAX protease family)
LEPAARAALIEPVPRDHAESDAAFHRRRVVVLVTLASGTSLLGLSLSVRPGGFAFYPLTLAVALVWIVGGFLSGPLHWGSAGAGGRWQRPVVSPIVIGLAAAAVFVVGALVVREIPPLRDYVQHVLNHARRGSLTAVFVLTLLNGAAEEIFFRGGLYAAVGRRRPVVISTVIYAVATVATGNPVLVFAALTLGFVLALQRRASGGILAPMLTHVVWSAVLFVALPPLF